MLRTGVRSMRQHRSLDLDVCSIMRCGTCTQGNSPTQKGMGAILKSSLGTWLPHTDQGAARKPYLSRQESPLRQTAALRSAVGSTTLLQQRALGLSLTCESVLKLRSRLEPSTLYLLAVSSTA